MEGRRKLGNDWELITRKLGNKITKECLGGREDVNLGGPGSKGRRKMGNIWTLGKKKTRKCLDTREEEEN